MPKYGESAQKSVERAMHKRKHGTLRSGGSGKKVTSRKQAIAIGLSEAREKGAKVPSKRSSSKRGASARKKTGARRTRRTTTSGKKRASKKAARR